MFLLIIHDTHIVEVSTLVYKIDSVGIRFYHECESGSKSVLEIIVCHREAC